MKTVNLVSISFPGRDLCLGPVSVKSYALKDEEVAANYNINISQYDLGTPINDIVEILTKKKADVYGFTAYVWNIKDILEISEQLEKALPYTVIVLGGPQASGMAKTLLEDYKCLDFIFVGEGEKSFRSFLSGDKLSDVPGLVYRTDSVVMENPEPPFVNLDEFSLPYESEDYRAYLDNSPITVRAAIETSRGCPFHCGYCTWGRQRMRYFDLEKLKPAFDYLFQHPNVRTVYITDSNPFLRRTRTIELIEMLIELNVHKKSVTFELSPEYMNDERILDLLPQLYNDEFALGVQSTSPEVLNLMNRKFNSERYRHNIMLMKEKNPAVRLWFSLIIGLPGDNYEQFSDSLDYVINLNPEGIYVHELLCLPGSDYYKDPEKYGIKFMEEAPHKILENKTFPQEEYDRAKLLSYFVYLIHHFDEIRNGIYELRTKQIGMRLVDYYSKFEAFVNGEVDYLLGRDIQDVTSWFFEAIAQEFMSDTGRTEQLQNLYHQFVKEEAWG
ncbi:MAG: B12-binding domain-containing radical SAM protein [Candidatus Thorarchaeota archaeon]|jgi:anaerobic magnesium-protoporphyrin IX monomethyl ester cyclase